MTSDETIARLRREMADASAELPDPNMEAVPMVRAQKAERRRVLAEQQSELSGIDASLSKCRARVAEWRGERVRSVDAIALSDDRGASAPSEAERFAWRAAARHLRGERTTGSELPGPIIMMRRESGDRLATLPTIDEELSRAETDLAAAEARLQSVVDTWDRRSVRGTIDATLPSAQSESTATVK